MTTRVDRAARMVHARPERVFAALVDRDALERWLPPAGMSGRFEHFDAQPGGSYRLVLSYREPGRGKTTVDSDVVEVRFVAIEPPVRIVQVVDFDSEDPAFAGRMSMIWQLDPVEGGTRVEVTARDVPEGVSAEEHAEGLRSSLENLAHFVESQRA